MAIIPMIYIPPFVALFPKEVSALSMCYGIHVAPSSHSSVPNHILGSDFDPSLLLAYVYWRFIGWFSFLDTRP